MAETGFAQTAGNSRDYRLDLGQTWQARSFVRRYLYNAGDVHRLRSLLPSHFANARDEQVLEHVAHLLQVGQLRAYLYPTEPLNRTRAPSASSAAAAATPAPRAIPPAQPGAQPGTPSASSANSVPLVPITTVAPAPEQAASVAAQQDVEAQMLEASAEEGMAFCAVCNP